MSIDAFQINKKDNVATVLRTVEKEELKIGGDFIHDSIIVTDKVLVGHKIALVDISIGSEIIKYGAVIGVATKNILKGSWVHLHCMKSCYDEKSSGRHVILSAD